MQRAKGLRRRRRRAAKESFKSLLTERKVPHCVRGYIYITNTQTLHFNLAIYNL